jgi:hypothetical protein
MYKNILPHKFETIMLEVVKNNNIKVENEEDKLITLEVFVDDFIGMTNNASLLHLTQLSRAMFHGIHSIFPPLSITGHDGEDPISEKNKPR